MNGGFSSREREMINAAVFPLAQHFINNGQRQITGGCVPLCEAVQTLQVTAVG
jgi:hypothetical protein